MGPGPSPFSNRLFRPRLVIAALAIVTVAAGAWWWASRPALPEPPPIETLGAMDPDVAALVRERRSAVVTNRDDASSWGRFAMACEANGLLDAARLAYATAATLAPSDASWWYRLALVRARLGEHGAAFSALTRANELAPGYGPAWVRRGLWLLDRGNTSDAEAAFGRALAIDAEDAGAAAGLGRVHLARREDSRAVEVLEGLLERHPGDRYALQLLGTAYRRVGRVEDAAFALAVGADGEPRWADPWSEEVGNHRRGFAAMLKTATAEAMAGRLDRALPLLERLRRERPDDVALANHLANVLVAAGRHGDAIELLRPLLRGGGGNAETHLTLASAYVATRDAGRAEAHVDRAMALGSAGARAHEIKGLIAWRTGRTTEAVRVLFDGYARDPRRVTLLAWIGLIRLEEGRPHEAQRLFAEVLRRTPMAPEALAGLAMASAALGQRDEAALALARAEQVAPDHPRVREARQKVAPR